MEHTHISDIDDLLPEESLMYKLKTKGLWIYILSFVVMPFSYIIKVIVSNELSVEDVGLMYGLLGFVGILSVYNDLGLADALQYFVPKYVVSRQVKKIRGILIVVIASQLLSGLLLGGGMFVMADWLANHYFSTPEIADIIQYFGLYFLLLNVFQASQSFYYSVQHVKLEKTIELLRMAVVCACTVGAWQMSTLTLQTFAMSWLIGLVLAVMVSMFFFWRGYAKKFLIGPYEITKKDTLRWLGYGFWSLLGANAWTIISQIDLQIILYFIGKQASGYWTNYLSITSLMIFIFVPLLSFCFPFFTELIEKRRFSELRMARGYILGGIVLYGFFLGIVSTLYGHEIATFIFGDKYIVTGQLLIYSAWLLSTPLLGVLNFQYIRSFGKVRWVTILQMVVVILHIGVSLLVVYLGGDYFYLSIVLHLSHLLFYLVAEYYIHRYIHARAIY